MTFLVHYKSSNPTTSLHPVANLAVEHQPGSQATIYFGWVFRHGRLAHSPLVFFKSQNYVAASWTPPGRYFSLFDIRNPLSTTLVQHHRCDFFAFSSIATLALRPSFLFGASFPSSTHTLPLPRSPSVALTNLPAPGSILPLCTFLFLLCLSRFSFSSLPLPHSRSNPCPSRIPCTFFPSYLSLQPSLRSLSTPHFCSSFSSLLPFPRSARFARLALFPLSLLLSLIYASFYLFPRNKSLTCVPPRLATTYLEQENTRERAPERARFLVAVNVLAVDRSLARSVVSKRVFCTPCSVKKIQKVSYALYILYSVSYTLPVLF